MSICVQCCGLLTSAFDFYYSSSDIFFCFLMLTGDYSDFRDWDIPSYLKLLCDYDSLVIVFMGSGCGGGQSRHVCSVCYICISNK